MFGVPDLSDEVEQQFLKAYGTTSQVLPEIPVTEADFDDVATSPAPSKQEATATVAPPVGRPPKWRKRGKFRTVWNQTLRLEIACKLIPKEWIDTLRFLDQYYPVTTKEFCARYGVCSTRLADMEQMMVVIQRARVDRLERLSDLLENSNSPLIENLMKDPSHYALQKVLRRILNAPSDHLG